MPGHVLILVQTSPSPSTPDVVQRLVSVADQLGDVVTTVIFRKQIRTREVGRLLEGMGERARALQEGYDTDVEELAQICSSAAAQAGLEFQLAEIDLDDDSIEALVRLARSHDCCVMAVGPTVDDELDVLAALLHRAGRPVILVPDRMSSPLSPRWERAVVAWTPSGQVARAMKEAVPLLRRAKAVSVLVVQEKIEEFSVDRALEAVRYLETRGVGADIRSVPADGQRVGQRIVRFMNENSADFLIMGAPSQPLQAEFSLQSKVTDAIEDARWVMLLSA